MLSSAAGGLEIKNATLNKSETSSPALIGTAHGQVRGGRVEGRDPIADGGGGRSALSTRSQLRNGHVRHCWEGRSFQSTTTETKILPRSSKSECAQPNLVRPGDANATMP